MELWLCALIGASGATLLMVGWSRSHISWLVVVMTMLCNWIWSGSVAVILLSAICGCCVIHLSGRKEDTLPVQSKAVLITGCDSGFGHNLAKILDKAGMKVYAGVLEEFGPGAQELREISSSQLTVLQMDITNTDQISEAHKLIKSQIGETGEVPFPGFAAYGASKAAMISYYGALRQELSHWGVTVAILQPGAFKTSNQEEWSKIEQEILSTQPREVIDAYGKEYIYTMQKCLSNITLQSCADFRPVLENIQHALLSEKPKNFYYPGHAAWAIPFLQRICPAWLFDVIFAQIFTYDKFSPAGRLI
ncbi:Estradiol 17-beta-dehydrogenase 2 [Bagarius yarrelli]|uniref:Estradiol 17-beta-dehydrogenase 2 n=1 Tax=Bagarius yarrelli TaxID=175774 RepID=A0A556U421_BAGYA|nr:Estradiol 17-beta-dehydrogenase 2 [Bagarius yarrelli]